MVERLHFPTAEKESGVRGLHVDFDWMMGSFEHQSA